MGMLHRALYLSVILAPLFHVSQCNPEGAPQEACADMQPQHGVDPQLSDAPYTITVDNREFSPGDRIAVNITVKESEDVFRGFLLQARHRDVSHQIGIGEWSASVPGIVSVMNCDGAKKNAATHMENGDKQLIELVWTAPKSGELAVCTLINIWGTVVETHELFWTNISSLYMAPTQDYSVCNQDDVFLITNSPPTSDITDQDDGEDSDEDSDQDDENSDDGVTNNAERMNICLRVFAVSYLLVKYVM